MSKRFRIVKRISKEDTGHFEDIEVDDDFVDNEMAQIIVDNEYDPLYDDCENIAVALQLAGYGKVADLEAKLVECEKSKESYRLQNEQHHLQLLQFYSRLGVEAFGADIHEKALETLMLMKEELKESESKRKNLEEKVKWLSEENEECFVDGQKYNELREQKDKEIQQLKQQLAEKDKENTKLKEVVDCVDKLKQFNADMKDYALVNRDVADEIYFEHQDKISFAVEQLEKVKGLIANHTQELWTCENDDIDVVLYEEIDKQINELKGKVE